MSPRLRASAVVVHQGSLLVVRVMDKVTGREYLTVPGGGVEPGEEPADAAAREALEETGYAVRVDRRGGVEGAYVFNWEGGDVDCHTWFFRGVLDPAVQTPGPVVDSLVASVSWLPLEQFEAAFSYHPDIRGLVRSLLE